MFQISDNVLMQTETFFPTDPQFYLRSELDERIGRRPCYSLRAFARDLEISPASLSEFLKGKTGLSKDRVYFIAKKLKLSEDHKNHFLDLVNVQFSRNETQKITAKNRAQARVRSKTSQLALDQFKVIAEWYHLAILELIDLDKKYQSSKILAQKLQISEKTVKQAMVRLSRIGLLEKVGPIWKPTSSQTNVGDQCPSISIQYFHQQMLEKAAEALTQQSVRDRDFTVTIMSVRKQDIPAMKQEISLALKNIISKYYHHDGKDALYCLSNYFYRMGAELIESESEK